MRRVSGPGSGLLCTGSSADPSWGQEESRAGGQPPGSWTPSASDTLSACTNDGP